MIGKRISHYKILEKIGKGGMGVVYKAQDTKLDRVVALKFLPEQSMADEDAKGRFIQEAKAASAIDHPNIATVHDIDEVEGQSFISMAYIEGKPLKELAMTGGLSIQEVVKIAIQAAEGLGAAHKKGIVHRDVKSDNLMLTSDGHVKVMDFGLAKLKGATGLTKAGQTVGTAYYMSPEQTKGEEVDHRSDVFSLGVVLYELLTGKLPFTGEYDPAIAYSIVNEQPQRVSELRSDVPAELEGVVMKALEKDVARRYQDMGEMISDLKNLWEGRTSEIRTFVTPGRSRARFLVPAVAILGIVVIVLLMSFLRGEGPPAGASENTLAVMYFDNMVDPGDAGRLGEIVANLLITDLSESRFVSVVSSQRLYDILKNLGKEGAKVIDESVASQVAEKARAKWMLLGNILQTEPYMVVTSQLVEVASGNIVKSQEIRGREGEQVFDIVDRLTAEVKKDLRLPDEALEEPDTPVASLTTASPEAYRYYLEGVDYSYKNYVPEAIRSFNKAFEVDSTFTMAYFRLAVVISGTGDFAAARSMLDKADQYSYKATRKERYLIDGYKAFLEGDIEEGLRNLHQIVEHYPEEKEAYLWLGAIQYRRNKLEESIEMLNIAIEIDPLYKSPYNMLAYVYDLAGDFEKSIWAINKYIELAPDEANPYDTRGELYAHNGKVDLAIASYEKALERKEGYPSSLEALGHLWLLKRDYSKAREYYQKLASSGDANARANGRGLLALIPMYKGQFQEALGILDEAITADRMENAEGLATIGKHADKVAIYRELGDIDGMASEVERLLAIARSSFGADIALREFSNLQGLVYLHQGEFARVEDLAESLRVVIEASDRASMPNYWFLKGRIEEAAGDMNAAAKFLEMADEGMAGTSFGIRYNLSKVYIEAGRLADAVTVLEKAVSKYDQSRAESPIKSVKIHYLLGQAYEGSGWTDRAIEQYEEFLDIWKDADPGNPAVEDAKARLAALRNAAARSL